MSILDYHVGRVHGPENDPFQATFNTLRLLNHYGMNNIWRGYHRYITGSDLMKVQAANALYQAAVTLLEICMQLKCCITIENPLRSWLWMLLAHYIKQSGNQALIDWYSNLECVTFDACAHGSDRDKRTKLLATPGVFSDLEQYCPKNHQHASWAPYKVHNRLVSPTATEAEYPSLLCSRMSACVQQFAASHEINLMLEPKLKDLMKLNWASNPFDGHH